MLSLTLLFLSLFYYPHSFLSLLLYFCHSLRISLSLSLFVVTGSSGWILYQQQPHIEYLFVDEPVNFWEANKRCLDYGGSLATFTARLEQEYIKSELSDRYVFLSSLCQLSCSDTKRKKVAKIN